MHTHSDCSAQLFILQKPLPVPLVDWTRERGVCGTMHDISLTVCPMSTSFSAMHGLWHPDGGELCGDRTVGDYVWVPT